MDTRKLLEELENVINNASEVPITNKKVQEELLPIRSGLCWMPKRRRKTR